MFLAAIAPIKEHDYNKKEDLLELNVSTLKEACAFYRTQKRTGKKNELIESLWEKWHPHDQSSDQ